MISDDKKKRLAEILMNAAKKSSLYDNNDKALKMVVEKFMKEYPIVAVAFLLD